DETSRNIARRLLYFTGTHGHLIPTFVSPQGGKHGGPEGSEPGPWPYAAGASQVSHRACFGEEQDASHDDRYAGNFENRQPELHLSTQHYSAAVQSREQDDHR